MLNKIIHVVLNGTIFRPVAHNAIVGANAFSTTTTILGHCSIQFRNDIHFCHRNHSIQAVTSCDKRNRVQVKWDNGYSAEYPYTWLRDNCQCSECFNPHSMSRMFKFAKLDPDEKIVDAQADTSGNIKLTWEKNHVSTFDSEWLRKRCFSEEARSIWRASVYKPDRLPWNHTHQISKYKYDEMMTGEKCLYKWLHDLREYGISILTEAPCKTGIVMDITGRVAYPRNTVYGPTFDVQSKVAPSNLAYTPSKLGLHTDQPTYKQPPGIQLLHCIKQTDDAVGGENQFSDGLYAAEKLRREHPNYFKTLTTVLVDYWDYGTDYVGDFYTAGRKNVIQLDRYGNVDLINYSTQLRSSHLDLPVSEVDKFYYALKEFDNMLYHPECLISYKLHNGDVVAFDNTRVPHGRAAYTTRGGERFLQGTYIDWDEALSRMRRLRVESGEAEL